MNPTLPELSQKDFAALRGVSEPMVVKWKRKGRLVMSEDGKRVRVAESIALLEATRDPGRGGDRTGKAAAAPQGAASAPVPPDGSDLNYQREAARDKRASAMQRELELAEKAGALVVSVDVEHRIAGHVRAATDYLASSRRRIAPTLALEADARKVEQLLEERDREFCTKLAALAAPQQEAQDEAA